MFATAYKEIMEQVAGIDPLRYGKTRNFINGAVTRLSPYISRGVISTKVVMQSLQERGFDLRQMEKMIQELAWRDYWQLVWMNKGKAIDDDLKNPQPGVLYRNSIPAAVEEACTGIDGIDNGINALYKTGYMHNHVRMYTASLVCNIGHYHWLPAARWMYYHLLDADWASNALSWQWVAGSNSGKLYYANQENINRYTFTHQSGTFLDTTYDRLPVMDIPARLQQQVSPKLVTPLPDASSVTIHKEWPVCIYNFYNLDPLWRSNEKCNRILLLEPALFDAYPVSEHTLQFVMELAENIPGIQVFTGSFNALLQQCNGQPVYFKEHPLNHHYKGTMDSRDWMFDVKGYFPSFFAYWKKCAKFL